MPLCHLHSWQIKCLAIHILIIAKYITYYFTFWFEICFLILFLNSLFDLLFVLILFFGLYTIFIFCLFHQEFLFNSSSRSDLIIFETMYVFSVMAKAWTESKFDTTTFNITLIWLMRCMGKYMLIKILFLCKLTITISAYKFLDTTVNRDKVSL